MDEDFYWGAQLSRLPGHHAPDDRMRYRVISVARADLPAVEVAYVDGSETRRNHVVDLIGIIESIDDPTKRYLAARRDRGPLNFFFDGIQSITDNRSGRTFSLQEVARELFEPPIEA